jgi:hypothetical protein
MVCRAGNEPPSDIHQYNQRLRSARPIHFCIAEIRGRGYEHASDPSSCTDCATDSDGVA